MRDSEVKVSLYRSQINAGYFQVRLRSQARPGLISEVKLKFENSIDIKEMARQVEISGGALAEYQCENYGDSHDPSSCAGAAIEAFYDLLADKGLGPKAR